ncbi:pentapeptide repeat-containing protein [Microcoleus sp. OTE_8_concoct_300]|uniref:pentapeptide repeat-containing protein n=1 Tax=Microcoleus sp. OTE_8_concoct_300 TaxID=2964710 RepID=UPI00403F70FF
MTLPRNLNFANQDLRNRSFKGLDLSGANFSGCDIRGCNFTGAILRGANFQGVRTGQSRRQVRNLIARAGVTAVTVTTAGALTGLIGGADAGAVAVTGTAATAIAVTRGEAGIVAGSVAGAAAAIGASGIVTFFGGDTLRGIVLFLVSGVILGLTAIGFFIAVEEIEKLAVTSFRKADLTDAVFDAGAIIDADFSDARGLW